MTELATIRSAVIGVGYLGKFHAQKYASVPGSQLIAVVDANAEQGQEIASDLGCDYISDYKQLVGKVDVVSIAAPTTLHFEIAKFMLESGIHVLVEKPITVTLEEADELIAIAKDKDLVLQVGHLLRFHAAIMDLDSVLTKPTFIEAHRLAPYKPRATDVNVVLDLMIHDIDIILSLVDSDVVDIQASGTNVLSNTMDICNVRLTFADGCVANVTASRISLKTERKMRIFQEAGYVSVDFQEHSRAYFYIGDGEMFPGVPNIESKQSQYEPGDELKAEIESFLSCVRTGEKPLVSGEAGRRALSVATTISEMVSGNQK